MMKRNIFIRGLLISTASLALLTGCALGENFAASFKEIGQEFLADSGIGEMIEDGQKISSAISKLVEEISDEDAYYIGRTVTANILTNYKIYSNPSLELYLNKICQAIVLNSDDPNLYNGYHVKILDSNEVNAFSTPAGHILVTRGLIDCAKSEDALAAVLAHEVAHIQLKHSLSAIKASRFKDTINTFDEVFSDNSMKDVSDDILSNMMGSGFSQGQEFDADEMAVQLMAAAGYQPAGMNEMLETMKTRESSSRAGFFTTHPSPGSRMYNLKQFIRKYKVEDTREYRTSRYAAAVK